MKESIVWGEEGCQYWRLPGGEREWERGLWRRRRAGSTDVDVPQCWPEFVTLCDIVTLAHCRAQLWPAWLHWNSWIPELSGAPTTSWDTLSFSSSITSVAGPAGTIWASASPFICPGSTMPISSTEERHDAPLTSPSFQYIVDRRAICEVAYQRIGRIASGVVTGADEGTSCSLVVDQLVCLSNRTHASWQRSRKI